MVCEWALNEHNRSNCNVWLATGSAAVFFVPTSPPSGDLLDAGRLDVLADGKLCGTWIT